MTMTLPVIHRPPRVANGIRTVKTHSFGARSPPSRLVIASVNQLISPRVPYAAPVQTNQ